MISNDITKDEVKKFKLLLDYFKQLANDGVTPLIERQLLSMLDHAVPFFSHLVLTGEFPELYRITINKKVIKANKRIRHIKDLKYPPKEKVIKYGRCNFINQPVFYGSTLDYAAMSETTPMEGDLVTTSIWRLKNNQQLRYCPIFKNQSLDDNPINSDLHEFNKIYRTQIKIYPDFVQEQIDTLVQFVADAFTKQIKHTNDLDYIFSAYFSNKIFNDLDFGNIEAIYYPSIKTNSLYRNIAIKPDIFDAKYELVKVSDGVRYNTIGNEYVICNISDCENFDYASGEILWDSSKLNPPPELLLDMKRKFGVDISW